MNKIRLSFIIPAYNAAPYIKRCLESIINLDLPESVFEVIVVDDCSTDNTIEILYDFQKLYSNLFYFQQQENHKQGAARNKALEYAHGDYITFIDSDDIVEKGIIIAIQQLANADVVVCRAIVEQEIGIYKIHKLINEPARDVDGRTFMQNNYDWHFVGAPWGYLFRAEYLRQIAIPFAEDVATEDEDWVNIHLYLAKSISCIPEVIYTNTYNNYGTTKSKRTLFMDVSRILCSYREFQYAEKYCQDDKERYDWFREIATYHIEITFKRLWKTECANYKQLYSMVDKNVRTYLLNITHWSSMVRYMFKYPTLCSYGLNFLAPLLRMMKNCSKITKM